MGLWLILGLMLARNGALLSGFVYPRQTRKLNTDLQSIAPNDSTRRLQLSRLKAESPRSAPVTHLSLCRFKRRCTAKKAHSSCQSACALETQGKI